MCVRYKGLTKNLLATPWHTYRCSWLTVAKTCLRLAASKRQTSPEPKCGTPWYFLSQKNIPLFSRNKTPQKAPSFLIIGSWKALRPRLAVWRFQPKRNSMLSEVFYVPWSNALWIALLFEEKKNGPGVFPKITVREDNLWWWRLQGFFSKPGRMYLFYYNRGQTLLQIVA